MRPVVLAGVTRPALMDFAFATVATLLLLAAIVVSTEDNCAWIHSDTLRGKPYSSDVKCAYLCLWSIVIFIYLSLKKKKKKKKMKKRRRFLWALYAYFNQ